MMSEIECPKCGRQWEQWSEQAVSIDWHGECVVCRFTPIGKGTNEGTKSELDEISKESINRQRLTDKVNNE